MHNIRYVLFILQIFILFSCNKEEQKFKVTPGSIQDDLNNTIILTSKPNRVISLAPNITEMIFAAGIDDKLAGNTLYCNFPEESKKVTKVGDLISIDYEKIIKLKPDLIFITVEGNVKDSYEKLNKLGFKVFVSNPRNYVGIKKTFSDIGKIFDLEDKTKKIINNWDLRYNKIINEAKGYPQKTAMFLIGLNPIILAGKNTFINELLTSAGLLNITADSPYNYPIFNREEIVKRNPDYILMTGMSIDETKRLVKIYAEWKLLKAVRYGNLIVVEPDLFLRPGPRFIEALEKLFMKLHPR